MRGIVAISDPAVLRACARGVVASRVVVCLCWLCFCFGRDSTHGVAVAPSARCEFFSFDRRLLCDSRSETFIIALHLYCMAPFSRSLCVTASRLIWDNPPARQRSAISTPRLAHVVILGHYTDRSFRRLCPCMLRSVLLLGCPLVGHFTRWLDSVQRSICAVWLLLWILYI